MTTPAVTPNASEQALAMRWARSIQSTPRTVRDMADFLAQILAEYREALTADLPPSPPEAPYKLSARELQMLQGIAEGKNNEEIGKALYISEDTVKTHNRRLFRKMNVLNRHHAVAMGFRYGFLR